MGVICSNQNPHRGIRSSHDMKNKWVPFLGDDAILGESGYHAISHAQAPGLLKSLGVDRYLIVKMFHKQNKTEPLRVSKRCYSQSLQTYLSNLKGHNHALGVSTRPVCLHVSVHYKCLIKCSRAYVCHMTGKQSRDNNQQPHQCEPSGEAKVRWLYS